MYENPDITKNIEAEFKKANMTEQQKKMARKWLKNIGIAMFDMNTAIDMGA